MARVIASKAKQSFKTCLPAGRDRFVTSLLAMTLILLMFTTSGCYILNKMDELSTMGEYARDKDDQHKIITKTNANYDALVQTIKDGKLQEYPDKQSILQAFGKPIAVKTIEVDGQNQEQWLYRHAIGQKAKDKVYLYFNAQDKFVKSEQETIEW